LQFQGYFQQPTRQSVSQRNGFAAASALELGTAGHVGSKRKSARLVLEQLLAFHLACPFGFPRSLHPPGERCERRKCLECILLPAGAEMKSSPSLINRTPAIHLRGKVDGREAEAVSAMANWPLPRLGAGNGSLMRAPTTTHRGAGTWLQALQM
jgi:hypothetical protein